MVKQWKETTMTLPSRFSSELKCRCRNHRADVGTSSPGESAVSSSVMLFARYETEIIPEMTECPFVHLVIDMV